MGTFAEDCAAQYAFTREEQDAFAIASTERALKANTDGAFSWEIAPVTVPGKGGLQLTGKLGDVKQHWPTLEQAVGTLKSAGAWISLAHPWQYDFTRSKRRRLVADFIAAGGHALEVVNGLQPAEQVGGLAILAREFGMLASVGSDFHAPGDWSELGMYRPLPEDLSPLWERFDHARATTA